MDSYSNCINIILSCCSPTVVILSENTDGLCRRIAKAKSRHHHTTTSCLYRLCHDYLRALHGVLSDNSYLFPGQRHQKGAAWTCYTTLDIGSSSKCGHFPMAVFGAGRFRVPSSFGGLVVPNNTPAAGLFSGKSPGMGGLPLTPRSLGPCL